VESGEAFSWGARRRGASSGRALVSSPAVLQPVQRRPLDPRARAFNHVELRRVFSAGGD